MTEEKAMKLAITKEGEEALSPSDIKNQVKAIQNIMKDVMKPGIHYALPYPTAKKPTLLKAGTEKLLMTFRLAPNYKIEDLSTEGEIRYRILTLLTYVKTNTFLGAGVGECSSNEEKYKWVEAVCDEQYEETRDKRIKYSKDYYSGKITKIQQIKVAPSDKGNTILKMAKKRSLVDAVLTCLAASDIFDQEECVSEQIEQKKNVQTPESKSQSQASPPESSGPVQPSGNIISDAQGKRLFAIANQSGKAGQLKIYLSENYGIDDTRQILRADYEKICEWAGTLEAANVAV